MISNGEPARRPGGAPRLAALVATAVGFFAVFTLGFPPAARDRLPVLLLALALGLLAAWNPSRGLIAFAFLLPLAGVGDRAFGGSDAVAWPVLLFAGFAGGWTFRFLYDFENLPDPSRLDGTLRALSAVWVVATAAAIFRGRTLWAFWHGLGLRAVNVEGLLDYAAIRDSVLSLAALASGVGFFFILRRSGGSMRDRALRATLAGCGVSGAVAAAEKLGLPPGETNAFWLRTGRLSGGAIDPNALGILCGLALVASAAWLLSGQARRLSAFAVATGSAAGLVLSGSRSGLLLAGVGVLALVLAPGLPAARRLLLGAAAAGGVLLLAAFLLQAHRGSLASRLALFMDPSRSVEERASSRPLLWGGALRLFGRHPIAGAGLGAYAWQLPNLMAEEGRSLPLRDNPGSAYLQALAETGAIGFLLVLVFVLLLAREAVVSLRVWKQRPLAAGSGAAVLGFLVALAFGSHWFAPDVSLAFFLFAACVARPALAPASTTKSAAASRVRRAAVILYAAAAAYTSLSTLSTEEAFRYRRGMGFHAKEQGSGGPYYWTERRFAIRLIPGETLRMGLAHYTPEGRPVELRAEADGKVIFRKTLQPGQGLPLRLSAGTDGPRVIRFTLSRAFVPRYLGLSADRRELGVIAVFPGG